MSIAIVGWRWRTSNCCSWHGGTTQRCKRGNATTLSCDITKVKLWTKSSSTPSFGSIWPSRKRRWNHQFHIPFERTAIRSGHLSTKDPRLTSITRSRDIPSFNGDTRERLLEILEQKRQRLVERHEYLTSKQATMELNSILQLWLDSLNDKLTESPISDDNLLPSPVVMWHWIEGMMPRLAPDETTILTLIHGIKASTDIPKRRDTALADLLLHLLLDLVTQDSGTKPIEDTLASRIASATLNPTLSTNVHVPDVNNPWLHVTFAFHSVMTMYCQSHDVPSSERLLRELEQLEEKNASLNLVTADTYSIVLSGWAQQSAPREAEYILNSMMNRAIRAKKSQRIFPAKRHFETCLSAWVKASSPSSGQRAELLLLKMQELYEKGRDTKPCCKSFSKVVAAWVNSRHKEAPLRADAIVQIMNEMDWSNETDTVMFRKRTTDTYLHAMKLWSWSDRKEAPEKCLALLRALDQVVGVRNIESVKLQRLYAALIATWAQSGRVDMVSRAENVWNELESHLLDIDSKDVDPVRDAAVYFSMLQVYAKSGNGERAEAVVKRILHESLTHRTRSDNPSVSPIKVDTKVLNFALLAWSRSDCVTAADRAEALFLQIQQQQSGDRLVVRPDVVTYNALLSVMSGCLDEATARRGMQYFRQMTGNDATCRPTTVTYTKAILLWSNIRTLEALKQSLALLDEMIAGDHTVRPDLATYQAFKLVVVRSSLAEPMRSRLIGEIQSNIEKLGTRGSKSKATHTEQSR